MKRREFITLLGGAAATWPLASHAQQPERMRKVGLLMGAESDPDGRVRVKALRQRLGELGWSEDRNTRIDVVWGAGDADHVRADAAELIQPLNECGGPWAPARSRARAQEADLRQLARLLRPRREWPRGRRAAEKRDELAPFHS